MLTKLGTFAFGAALLVAMFCVPLLLIKGAMWSSEHLLEPLITVGWLVLAVTIAIALPLSISKRMRGVVAIAIF